MNIDMSHAHNKILEGSKSCFTRNWKNRTFHILLMAFRSVFFFHKFTDHICVLVAIPGLVLGRNRDHCYMLQSADYRVGLVPNYA